MRKKDRNHTEEERLEKEKEKKMAVRIGKRLKGAAGFALFTGVCAGAGALAGAANYFYETRLVPKKHDRKKDSAPSETEYLAGREWVRNHGRREDVYIRADDGLQLHGSFIPSASAGCRRFAVCVHGDADSSESMGLYARVYSDRYGMNVLLPDLRGHGLSDGDYVGMGYHDGRDLLSWIDWILEKDPDSQIVLHGISMGAAAVLMATGMSLPGQVCAAVSDSAYTTAMEELAAVCKAQDKMLFPAPLLLESLRGIALVRAGYDLKKAAPVEAVTRSRTPTLFIHGQADQVVPPAMMPQLYTAEACTRAFLWIPGAAHIQAVNVDPETYWARVERFLHAQGMNL